MAIRQLRYDGDEILRKKSKKIEAVDDKIKELMKDMVETMHKENGVGLSAVQVGILKRVIVADIYDGNKPLMLANPEILKQKGNRLVEEGCLSFPNKFALVNRPTEVTVKALNENGEEITIKAKDLLAQVLCHEINHLDGVLFIDLMEPGTMQYIDPNNQQ